ncbi:MAG TPA: glycosyl hydrolase family 43 [Phycisphaerales bacterium]|nr:glycosyl hydrolase family 43 [Phycisphaerales bacterium]
MFSDRLLAAPVNGGFAMDGHWVWCGSAIRGDDGRYHLFASVWSQSLPFWPCWVTNSRIVRASADQPQGPYVFEETVLPARDPSFWDGRMTHNPSIHRASDGTYLLFYTGSTYDAPVPTAEDPGQWGDARAALARANQRVGLATAPSINGPWQRRDEAIIQPRPGKWDGLMSTNPAPCVLPDDSILLVYKSTANQTDLLRLGVSKAEHYNADFKRLSDESILNFDQTNDHVEDPYVWYDGNQFQLIMKDMEGGICGEQYGGIHACSPDGIHWRLADLPMAYSRTVKWDNGSTTRQAHFERPQLLIENGRPTYLFAATSDANSETDYLTITRTWTMVIPLA